MTRTALLLATTTRWLGVARMPRSLARAGFEVVLLTPRDSLAEKSGYVSRIGFLPDEATPAQWVNALARMIEASAPALLVPCDEMAVRLLIVLALDPPPGLAPAMAATLDALIRDSLGDPRHYAQSIDKTLLPPVAERLGVRVPGYEVVTSIDAAVAQAARLGFPALLKRRYGFAGGGVEVVNSIEEARVAAVRLLEPDQLDLGVADAPRLLVQAYIHGPYHSQALVARNGVPLQSFGWERHVATEAVKGQTSVLRFVDSPESLRFSEALCRAFGMSGFFNVQFVLDATTGEAHLLEINRRWVTHTHLGERLGRDLPQALAAALDGRPVPVERGAIAKIGDSVAVFPREWLRDPRSEALRNHPVDIPWDEPALIEALVAMRQEE